MKIYMYVSASFLVLHFFMTPEVSAKDIKGSEDHPMISRYEGSSIQFYKTESYGESFLFTAKLTREVKRGGLNETNHMRLEGKVTNIVYEIPAGRSTLEVMRNYQMALDKEGFKKLYECSDAECGKIDKWYRYESGMNLLWADKKPRYTAGVLKRSEGDVYSMIYAAGFGGGGERNKGKVYVALTVIELKPMEAGLVKADAEAMARDISKSGHVAIYGIYFDTDKADVKPGSSPALEEIAELLNNNPSMELVVVGHTDNQGAFNYNMDLSRQRAKAVMDKLIADYGIKQSRLLHWGVGFLSPVATNKTDDGRARNRRVELVER